MKLPSLKAAKKRLAKVMDKLVKDFQESKPWDGPELNGPIKKEQES